MQKILIIEDEPTILLGLKDELSEYYTTFTATNGETGLEFALSEQPDLILLDLVLPDINGIEILKKVRKEKGISGIPFFILTNYTDPDLEKEGKKLKVIKYLLKTDLNPSQLINSIEKWLKKKK